MLRRTFISFIVRKRFYPPYWLAMSNCHDFYRVCGGKGCSIQLMLHNIFSSVWCLNHLMQSIIIFLIILSASYMNDMHIILQVEYIKLSESLSLSNITSKLKLSETCEAHGVLDCFPSIIWQVCKTLTDYFTDITNLMMYATNTVSV